MAILQVDLVFKILHHILILFVISEAIFPILIYFIVIIIIITIVFLILILTIELFNTLIVLKISGAIAHFLCYRAGRMLIALEEYRRRQVTALL